MKKQEILCILDGPKRERHCFSSQEKRKMKLNIYFFNCTKSVIENSEEAKNWLAGQIRFDEGVNRDPGVDVNFYGKISNTRMENFKPLEWTDVTCHSRDRKDRPLEDRVDSSQHMDVGGNPSPFE